MFLLVVALGVLRSSIGCGSIRSGSMVDARRRIAHTFGMPVFIGVRDLPRIRSRRCHSIYAECEGVFQSSSTERLRRRGMCTSDREATSWNYLENRQLTLVSWTHCSGSRSFPPRAASSAATAATFTSRTARVADCAQRSRCLAPRAHDRHRRPSCRGRRPPSRRSTRAFSTPAPDVRRRRPRRHRGSPGSSAPRPPRSSASRCDAHPRSRRRR